MINDPTGTQHCDETRCELNKKGERICTFIYQAVKRNAENLEPLSLKGRPAFNEFFKDLQFTAIAEEGPRHWRISRNAGRIAEYRDRTDTRNSLPIKSEQDEHTPIGNGRGNVNPSIAERRT